MSFTNERKLERLIKNIPSLYRPKVNKFVHALILAWAQSDNKVELAIQDGKAELFIKSASEKNLEQLGSNVNVAKPLDVNLSTDKFRELIPILSFYPKQVRSTVYEILKIFWGELYSNANLTGSGEETYNLGPVNTATGTLKFTNGSFKVTGIGTTFTTELKKDQWLKLDSDDNKYYAKIGNIVDNNTLYLSTKYEAGNAGVIYSGLGKFYQPQRLHVEINNKSYDILIPPHKISNTTNAKADEIVESINDQPISAKALTAETVYDILTKKKYINLRTNTEGSTGSIKIDNGSIHSFAKLKEDGSGFDIRVQTNLIDQFKVGDVVRLVSDTTEQIETFIKVIDGDKITLDDNTNNFKVSENAHIFGLNSILNPFAFFTKNGVNSGTDGIIELDQRRSSQFKVGDKIKILSDTIDVPFEATIKNVKANKITIDKNIDQFKFDDSSYFFKEKTFGFKESKHDITKLIRSTIVYEISTNELTVKIPAIVPAIRRNLIGSWHLKDKFSGLIKSVNNTTKKIVADFDGEVLKDDLVSMKLEQGFESFTIKSHTIGKNGVELTFDSLEDLSALSTIKEKNGFIITSTKYLGPFIFDPKNANFLITHRRCELNELISKGSAYSTIKVKDAANMPTTIGHISLAFGTKNEEQPIQYLGRLNNSVIRINSGHVFEKTHSTGEMINIITLDTMKLNVEGKDYQAYLTGIELARISVQNIILSTKAAGISVRFLIDYPKYNFDDFQEAETKS